MQKKLICLLSMFTLLLFAGYLLYLYNGPCENITFYRPSGITALTGFQAGGQDITLPDRLPAAADETVSIRCVLPDTLPVHPAILFRTSQQRVRVFLDGTCIYSYGYDQNAATFGKTPGSTWALVPLPDSSGKSVLTAELSSPYDSFAGMLHPVFLGEHYSLILCILYDRLYPLLLSFALFIAGLILCIFHLLFARKTGMGRAMLHLSLFSLLIASWFFGELRLIQFFSGNIPFFLGLTIFSMLLAPVPLIHYFTCSRSFARRQLADFMCMGFYIECLLLLFLHFTGIRDIMEMLGFAHLYLLLNALLFLFLLAADYRKERTKEARLTLYSVGIILLAAFLEMFTYYTKNWTPQGGYIMTGALAFVLLQALFLSKKALHVIELSRKAGHYALLASHDEITQCRNRRALDEKKQTCDPENVSIVIADIDNLKYINDSFGHQMGDDAIIRCSHNLHNILGGYGDIYRIGGDEFLFWGKDLTEKQLDRLLMELQDSFAKENRLTVYPFQVSCGPARYDKSYDKHIDDTIKRADLHMYRHKSLSKQQKASTESL